MTTKCCRALIYPSFPEFTEVFDLIADPYEINNLASDEKLTAKLDAELEQLVKSVNYTMPSGEKKARKPDPAKPSGL